MRKILQNGSVLVFLGALCWSLNSPLVKYLTMDSLFICALRSAIAGIALCAFIRPKRLNWNPWMAVYLVCYMLVCACVVVSLSMTAAPIAVGMQYTSIVWLFLVGLVRTKRLRRQALLPVLIIVAGMLFFMCSGGGEGSDPTGNLIALTTGVTFALLTVSSRRVVGENAIGLTALANLFTALVLFPFIPRTGEKLAAMTGLEWGIMLFLGVVQIGMGHCLYNMGVKRIAPQKAAIIALWEMILGPLWVAIFLHEYPNALVLIGFVLILAGLMLDALWNTEREDA